MQVFHDASDQVSMPSSTAPGELQQRGDLNGEQSNPQILLQTGGQK
jgi:hypothetical protein